MRELTEIIGDIRQGFCEPILCADASGTQFVVKTRSAGRLSLIKEWIAGRIAKRLGLPVPPFDTCYLSPARAIYMVHREASTLAECPCFASQAVKDYVHLSPAVAGNIANEMRARILLFDWWTLNGDRTDENANLLWVAHKQEVHVIDHNLCFDRNLSAEEFWNTHIFRADRMEMSRLEQATKPAVADIIEDMPIIWNGLPESWLEGPDLTVAEAQDILRRIFMSDFWRPQ